MSFSTASTSLKPSADDDNDYEEEIDEKDFQDDEEDDDGEEEESDDDDDDEENVEEEDQEDEIKNRNVGKKYKKWTSEKERVKFYKKKEYGATISARKKVGEVKEYPPIPEEGLIIDGYSISQFGRIRV